MDKFGLLQQRIRDNLDPCELVEYLDLSIDETLDIFGRYIWDNQNKLYFLLEDRYEELE